MPIFLATLAVQQKSQTIRFRTAAEMLETFGMQTGGKEYRRLVGAFERVFGATIFFGTDALRVGEGGSAIPVQLHARGADLVQPVPGAATDLQPSSRMSIVLSDDFYQEILAHPVPNDLEAVKVLAASPAVLDLYMWLSYRSFKAKGRSRSPSSATSAWPISWAASSTADRGGSEPCSNSGWTRYAESGPTARRELSRTAKRSRSGTQPQSVEVAQRDNLL